MCVFGECVCVCVCVWGGGGGGGGGLQGLSVRISTQGPFLCLVHVHVGVWVRVSSEYLLQYFRGQSKDYKLSDQMS